jgi:hypothetical protein
MTNTSQLARLALINRLLAMAAEHRPSMPLEAAAPLLSQLVIEALTEPDTPGTIEQTAMTIFHGRKVQELLPPWDD